MSELLIQGRRVDIASITVPWRLNILLDVSASMKHDNKIDKAKKGINTFLYNVSQRRRNPNDWVKASCFSGYVKTKNKNFYYKYLNQYCRIAHPESLRLLAGFINSWQPVWHGTALYDAIIMGSKVLYHFTQNTGLGVNAVIAVTDGKDNAGTSKPSQIGYPNANLNLSLIGVGRDSLQALSELKPYATSTHYLDDFGELYKAMFVALSAILEQRFGVQLKN